MNTEFLVFERCKGRTFKLQTKIVEVEKPMNPKHLSLNSTFKLWNNGLTYKVEHKGENYIRYRCVEKGNYKSRTASMFELASFPQLQIVEL